MRLHIDGDAVIWKAASPVDGRCYTTVEGQEFKYKRDAVANTAFPDDVILTYEPEPDSHAIHSAKLLMGKVVDFARDFGFHEDGDELHVEVFINGDDENFRRDIDPDYKLNREGARRPYHEATIKEWLQRTYSCTLAMGLEVDDLLGIHQSEDSVIVSHDKDLNMIPGKHIHMHKNGSFEGYVVHEIDAIRNFYKQLLIGDKTDNIPGIHGIGVGRAGRLLDHIDDELDMYNIVCGKYVEHGIPPERMVKNGQLLWILREEGEPWIPPLGLTERELNLQMKQ